MQGHQKARKSTETELTTSDSTLKISLTTSEIVPQQQYNHSQDNTEDTEEDQPYRRASYVLNPSYTKKAITEKDLQLSNLRKTKLFPLFEDTEVAKSSINYFLYLEFYNVAINLFIRVFLFSCLAYGIYYLIKKIYYGTPSATFTAVYYSITGIFVTFILRFFQRREDERIFNHQFLYEFQWSEDLFSLLIQNIPKDCTKYQIGQFFSSLFSQKVIYGGIVDVIFVQDYLRFSQIYKQTKSLKSQLASYSAEDTSQKKLDLLQKLKTLQSELSSLKQDIADFKLFKGKAIVVFNSIQAKNTVIKHLSPPWYKSLLISLCSCCFKSYYLGGNRISFKEIPEPEILLLENLHYPLVKRIIRTPFAYFVSFLVFALVVATLGALNGWKLNETIVHDESLLDNKFYSMGLAIFIMLLASAFERIYKYVQMLFVHSSILSSQINMINYNMYIVILLYTLIQGFLGCLNRERWIKHLFDLSVLYMIKRFLLKVFAIFSANNTLKKISKEAKARKNTGFLTELVASVYDKNIEFNFVKGLSDALPFICMGLAFTILHPFMLLPIFTVSLYVFAILDKYRMTRCCNLFTAKATKLMLIPFRIFRWGPLMAYCFGVAILYVYVKESSKTDADLATYFDDYLILFGSLAVFGVLFFVWGSKPLHLRVQERFADKNGKIQYHSVSNQFSSFYQRQDPFANMMSSSSTLL